MTDRYKSLIGYKEENDDSALVKIATEVIPVPAPPTPPKPKKTLFDLTPKGQEEMETLIAKKDPAIDSVLEDWANKTFQETKPDESLVDLTGQDLQITFDISEDMSRLVSRILSPADRIERLDISLSLDDTARQDEKFTGWSQVTTRYGQYNIGGISFGRTSTATLDPSVTIGTVTASVGSLAKADSFQQSDTLIQQFVSLSGHLSEKDFVLEMNSVPSTTLLGRTSLSVNLKARNIRSKFIYSFSGLFDDKGVAAKPEKVKIKNTAYLLPILGRENQLNAVLSCNYLIRHVDKGAETYFEGDDAVKYYYGHFSQPVPALLVKDEVMPKAWIIRRDPDPAQPWNRSSVSVENLATGEIFELNFIHFMDAVLLLHWLQNPALAPQLLNGVRIGGYRILTPGRGAFSPVLVPF
jgi:hypothetical protein